MENIEVEIRSFISLQKYGELLDFFKENAEFISDDDQETYYAQKCRQTFLLGFKTPPFRATFLAHRNMMVFIFLVQEIPVGFLCILKMRSLETKNET